MWDSACCVCYELMHCYSRVSCKILHAGFCTNDIRDTLFRLVTLCTTQQVPLSSHFAHWTVSISLSLSSYPCTQCGKDAKTTMNIDQLFKQSLELSTITLNMLVIVYSSYIHMHTHTVSSISLALKIDQVMWLYYRYVYIVIWTVCWTLSFPHLYNFNANQE